MNLVLLVEGAETEPKVYRAWIANRAPQLQSVSHVADLTNDQYVLVSGHGYPSCYRRLQGLLRDIADHSGKVSEFWLCLDSDEDSFKDRHDEATRAIEEAAAQVGLWQKNPLLKVRALIQHCCIETWFLGNSGFLRAGPQSRDLVEFKRFFDVSRDDPEAMGTFPGYVTKASFHVAYLKAMLAERGHRYSKCFPGVVREPAYLAALEKRCTQTDHLRSLHYLLGALAGCRAI